MREMAVVVSDLHMGCDPRLDNFAGDGKFARFCERVAAFSRDNDIALTFILAGDIFEMWEMAPQDETSSETPAAHITANLYYPAKGAAAEAAATERGKWQIDQALASHSTFAEGIGSLAAVEAPLLYLPGNHDHSMVNAALQQHLRTRLSELTNLPINAQRLSFDYWHRIDSLKLYVEHGHQFADNDSASPDVTDWRTQPPGYYFLRYVYSRLEGLPEMHVPFGELVRIILNLIFHPQVIDHKVKQYLYEYFAAHEAVGFPLAQGPSVPFVGHILPALFEHWKHHGRPLDQGSEELARECLELTGRAQTEQVDGTPENLDDFVAANLKKTKGKLPGRMINFINAFARDRYAQGFRERFSQAKAPFPKLSPVEGMTVIAGHTHREHHSRLLDAHTASVRYINCGSWASGPSRTIYAAISDDANLFRSRSLYRYR